MVSHVLQALHIYYVFHWLSSRAQFKRLDQILKSFLWSRYGGDQGRPMVSWEVCSIPEVEGGLDLIDMATQGHILAMK